jgi:hypothetical protein
MIFCALAGSSQKVASSTLALSSFSRRVDFSQSKMPPQQPDRLLDGFHHRFDFRTHCSSFMK